MTHDVPRIDVNFTGAVPGPPTAARVADDASVRAAYDNLLHWARTADDLGFDTMWLTEHHFMRSGHTVTPNQILMAVHLAAHTRRLRFGQMFNVVPLWHPVRLAEDFALADALTGGRLELGVARGTVRLEAEAFGATTGTGGGPDAKERDARNRALFEESMDLLLAAWSTETFRHDGEHFTVPGPTTPPTDGTDRLQLIPRPRELPRVFMPISPGRTSEYAAAKGFDAVVSLDLPENIAALWSEFADRCAAHGRELAPGEARAFHLIAHVTPDAGPSPSARAAYDEWCAYLSQRGAFRTYGDVPFGYRPPWEETQELATMAIGSVDRVVDTIGRYVELLRLRHLVLFVELPGLDRPALDDQMHLLAEAVLPQLGIELTAPAVSA